MRERVLWGGTPHAPRENRLRWIKQLMSSDMRNERACGMPQAAQNGPSVSGQSAVCNAGSLGNCDVLRLFFPEDGFG